MTAIAQEILKNFDELPDSDQVEVALAILKRLMHFGFLTLG